MRKINGIGWDDEYYSDRYFDSLKTLLKNDYNINFEVDTDQVEFQNRVRGQFRSRFDFAVLDMVDDSVTPPKPHAGYDLAHWLRSEQQSIPIFIITRDVNEVIQKNIILSQPFFYFSKGQSPKNVAFYIREVLERQGALRDKVFLGHGHSPEWEKLRSFLNERGVPVSEFNEQLAGNSVMDRMNEMKKESDLAILVFTGEDQLKDGRSLPRRNVVHEAGFFQGSLGFEKTQILLEENCEFFSNNQGILYETFPKGKLENTFATTVTAFLAKHGY